MNDPSLPTNVLWHPLRHAGFEHLRLTDDRSEIQADGIVVTEFDRRWRRYRYFIRLDPNWHVRTVELLDLDATHIGLYLYADANGNLRTTGRTAQGADRAADADLAFTPFTNTLPIRRYPLKVGESKTLNMLHLTTPERDPTVVRQQYTRLPSESSHDRYRFENVNTGYQADLVVDHWGLVVHYPDLYRRADGALARPLAAPVDARGEPEPCA